MGRTLWIVGLVLGFGLGLEYLGVFFMIVLCSVLDVTLTFMQMRGRESLRNEVNPLARWLMGLRGGPRPFNYLLCFCVLIPFYIWVVPLLGVEGRWMFAGMLLMVNVYHIANLHRLGEKG